MRLRAGNGCSFTGRPDVMRLRAGNGYTGIQTTLGSTPDGRTNSSSRQYYHYPVIRLLIDTSKGRRPLGARENRA